MNHLQAATTSPRTAQGYRPGLIGQIVALHAETCSRWAGFGSAFEAKVANELAEFIRERDGEDNAIWHAALGDQLLGSIAIDGVDLGERHAHLRWFIVDPSCRGAGLGRQLPARALDFVDERQFAETHLWTLQGLEAARSLYERSGFVLAEEHEGDQWVGKSPSKDGCARAVFHENTCSRPLYAGWTAGISPTILPSVSLL